MSDSGSIGCKVVGYFILAIGVLGGMGLSSDPFAFLVCLISSGFMAALMVGLGTVIKNQVGIGNKLDTITKQNQLIVAKMYPAGKETANHKK